MKLSEMWKGKKATAVAAVPKVAEDAGAEKARRVVGERDSKRRQIAAEAAAARGEPPPAEDQIGLAVAAATGKSVAGGLRGPGREGVKAGQMTLGYAKSILLAYENYERGADGHPARSPELADELGRLYDLFERDLDLRDCLAEMHSEMLADEIMDTAKRSSDALGRRIGDDGGPAMRELLEASFPGGRPRSTGTVPAEANLTIGGRADVEGHASEPVQSVVSSAPVAASTDFDADQASTPPDNSSNDRILVLAKGIFTELQAMVDYDRPEGVMEGDEAGFVSKSVQIYALVHSAGFGEDEVRERLGHGVAEARLVTTIYDVAARSVNLLWASAGGILLGASVPVEGSAEDDVAVDDVAVDDVPRVGEADEGLRERIAELEATLDAERASTAERFEALQAAADRAAEMLSEKNRLIQDAEAEVARAQARVEQAEGDLEAARAAVLLDEPGEGAPADRESEVREICEMCAATVDAAGAEVPVAVVETLRNEVAHLSGQLLEVRAQLQAAQEHRDDLLRSAARDAAEVEQLSKQLADVEEERDSALELRAAPEPGVSHSEATATVSEMRTFFGPGLIVHPAPEPMVPPMWRPEAAPVVADIIKRATQTIAWNMREASEDRPVAVQVRAPVAATARHPVFGYEPQVALGLVGSEGGFVAFVHMLVVRVGRPIEIVEGGPRQPRLLLNGPHDGDQQSLGLDELVALAEGFRSSGSKAALRLLIIPMGEHGELAHLSLSEAEARVLYEALRGGMRRAAASEAVASVELCVLGPNSLAGNAEDLGRRQPSWLLDLVEIAEVEREAAENR